VVRKLGKAAGEPTLIGEVFRTESIKTCDLLQLLVAKLGISEIKRCRTDASIDQKIWRAAFP
jgi:hypothetical protein